VVVVVPLWEMEVADYSRVSLWQMWLWRVGVGVLVLSFSFSFSLFVFGERGRGCLCRSCGLGGG